MFRSWIDYCPSKLPNECGCFLKASGMWITWYSRPNNICTPSHHHFGAMVCYDLPSPNGWQTPFTAPVAHGGMLQKGKVAADLMPPPRVDAHQQQGQRAPLELCIGRGPRENDGNPKSGVWNHLWRAKSQVFGGFSENCFQDLWFFEGRVDMVGTTDGPVIFL